MRRASPSNAVTTNGSAAKNGHAAPAVAVRLTHVAKAYGRNAVLKDISFSVAPGELVEVTGPSGSGKTTLLRLIHGQLRPTKGEVWVGGRGLHRWWRRGLGRIRRDVAFVFQDQRLLPRLTAFENLVFALMLIDPQVPYGRIRRRALDALESIGLAHRRKAYPSQLSAGERQRVAVARALGGRPRVLLADEPLNAIDDQNAQVVMRMLEEAAAAGTAVIVATHRPVFRAGRVLRLPEGTVMVLRSRLPAAAGLQGSIPLLRRFWPVNGDHGQNGHHSHNGHNGSHGSAQKPRGQPARTRLPWWRRAVALGANSYRIVVLGGLRSWRRDLRLAAPAMGTMALLLVLSGMLALVGIAITHVATQEASQASIVRVYLAADATPAAVSALEVRLLADGRVRSVTAVSPEQALAEARSRPGLDSLASLSDTNPFPASLDVDVRAVTDVAAVAAEVNGDPAVDPTYPTSYDPDTYSRLRRLALIVGAVGAGLLALFAIILYAVSANSMRGVAAARRDEVMITRLLGARGWMLRGPFMVEGLMTGALAGAVAGACAGGMWFLASRFAYATYAQVLPGVDLTSVRYVVAALIAAGLVIGVMTATLGFRRYRA